MRPSKKPGKPSKARKPPRKPAASGPSRPEKLSRHPLVAAYEAGRLLNELDWHLQQAWLLAAAHEKLARKHDREVKRIFDDLTVVAGRAAVLGDKEALSRSIQTISDEWEQNFISPAHSSELAERLRDLEEEARLEEIGSLALREAVCRDAVRAITTIVDRLRVNLASHLDEDGAAALALGMKVDQGIRPPRVYRFLYKPEQRKAPAPEISRGWEDLSLEAVPVPAIVGARDYLANVSIGPGKTPADPPWLREVADAWDHFNADQDGFAVANQLEKPSASQALVEDLDPLIRKHLGQQDDLLPQRKGKIPVAYRTRPMTYREAARYLGKRGSKAAEWLAASIRDRSIRCESLTRQSHIFDTREFPPEAQKSISPTDETHPNSP